MLTIKEIKKYIKSKGWNLQIWEEWGDLVGATLWCIKYPAIYISLNESGKYSAHMSGSLRKAKLKTAQKALWFAEKYLQAVK